MKIQHLESIEGDEITWFVPENLEDKKRLEEMEKDGEIVAVSSFADLGDDVPEEPDDGWDIPENDQLDFSSGE